MRGSEMVLQLSNGLPKLGDGSLVQCLGTKYMQGHGFLGTGHSVKVNLGSGRGRANCFARVRWVEFGGGQLNGRHQLQQQQRDCLVVWRSQRNGCPGEEEQQSPARRSVHFIGIGGAGLSALAFLALKQGWQVSGSVATANDRTKALEAAGATVYIGHAPTHLISPNRQSGLPDAVVVSSAIPRNNEEVEAAQKAGLATYKRADWLGKRL